MDDPLPAEGSAFSACTDVQWVPLHSTVPGLSLEGGATIAGAIILLWAIGYLGGVLRRAMQ